jgi:hypothetical protein
MPETITLELDIIDVEVLAVAFYDLRDIDGQRAWNHRNVARLRRKLADAIAEQEPHGADLLRRNL